MRGAGVMREDGVRGTQDSDESRQVELIKDNVGQRTEHLTVAGRVGDED
ncbi:hypothetical protein GCM10007047_29580 [Cerasicoccus arenae]|uniref:Uncharacterized protein n=1 Tax=Cerasicoccus arenae TaxID=424488 RepID=A0A8J3DKH4_9BACT|nr:hypothetical protein GCM10007047_29580 [Cerasicoccus arenae]